MERKLTIEITTSDGEWDTGKLNEYGWQWVDRMRADPYSPAIFTPEVSVEFVDGGATYDSAGARLLKSVTRDQSAVWSPDRGWHDDES